MPIEAPPPPTSTSASARRVSIHPPHRDRRPTPAAGTDGPIAPGRPLPVDTLADIALGLARAEELWSPHIGHDPLSRTALRLVATDAYEVWLLGWWPGQRVELHDHGASNAAFVVLDGTIDEVRLGPAGTTLSTLRAGDLATVTAGTIHDVVNPHDAPATSLHVYGDPLRTMTFYDSNGTPTHVDRVESTPAIHAPSATSRPLHPARSAR